MSQRLRKHLSQTASVFRPARRCIPRLWLLFVFGIAYLTGFSCPFPTMCPPHPDGMGKTREFPENSKAWWPSFACAAHADEGEGALDEEAMKAFRAAQAFKKAGKTWDAAQSFAAAVSKDRRILKQDDHGLVEVLRNGYQSQLDRIPGDPAALEGLAFVAVVCDGNQHKGLDYYEKALAATTTPAEKERLQYLISTLKAEIAATAQNPAPQPTSTAASTQPGQAGSTPATPPAPGFGITAGPGSPDQVMNDPAVRAATEELREQLEELSEQKAQAEARVKQLELDLKSTEEEIQRNHRRYVTSRDRRYKRQESAAENALADKQQELKEARAEVGRLGQDIDHLSGNMPRK